MKRLLLAAALAIAAIAPAKAEATLEEWYAAFFPGTAVRGLIRVSTPEMDKAGPRNLSPDERKWVKDRVRRAELADLVLYFQKCEMGYSQNGARVSAINKTNYDHIKAMFDAFPEDQRNEAIEYERKAIEARPDLEGTKASWDWFCPAMVRHANEYDDFVAPKN
jgi:hypothetical protein